MGFFCQPDWGPWRTSFPELVPVDEHGPVLAVRPIGKEVLELLRGWRDVVDLSSSSICLSQAKQLTLTSRLDLSKGTNRSLLEVGWGLSQNLNMNSTMRSYFGASLVMSSFRRPPLRCQFTVGRRGSTPPKKSTTGGCRNMKDLRSCFVIPWVKPN